MDWSSYYPAFVSEDQPDDSSQPRRMKQDVEIVDIGCGFGGLLVALAPLMPEKLMLGTAHCSFTLSKASLVSSRTGYGRSESKTPPRGYTKTRRVCAPTR